MIALNIMTLFVTTCAMSAYMSVAILIYYRTNKTYPGFGMWVVGSLLFLASYILLATRAITPPIISIVLANVIGISSNVVRLEGARQFFGLRPTWHVTLAAPVVIAIVFAYFTFVQDDILLRTTCYHVVVGVLCALTAYVFVYRSPRFMRPTAIIFSLMLVSAIIILIIRSVVWIAYPAERNLFSNTTFNGLTILLLLLSEFNWLVCVLLLNSQRLQREVRDLTVQLEGFAFTDPLTGVHNRHKFFDLSTQEIARSRRYQTPLTLLMFDLNHFKAVNDTHGHIAGDGVLQSVAQVATQNLRQADILARFGGDEFLILLPETGTSGALALAERINLQVQSLPIQQQYHMDVSISYGVTELQHSDTSISDLIQRADTLLYGMKRNRSQASSG